MVSPATYYGYDKDGNCVVRGTAEDATNYINPDEVQKKIDNLQQVFEEQMNKIVNNLIKIGEDSGQAIIVQGTKMTGSIEEAAQQIKQLPAQVLGDIHLLKDEASRARDEIQQVRNDETYNSVISYSGVTHIK